MLKCCFSLWIPVFQSIEAKETLLITNADSSIDSWKRSIFTWNSHLDVFIWHASLCWECMHNQGCTLYILYLIAVLSLFIAMGERLPWKMTRVIYSNSHLDHIIGGGEKWGQFWKTKIVLHVSPSFFHCCIPIRYLHAGSEQKTQKENHYYFFCDLLYALASLHPNKRSLIDMLSIVYWNDTLVFHESFFSGHTWERL